MMNADNDVKTAASRPHGQSDYDVKPGAVHISGEEEEQDGGAAVPPDALRNDGLWSKVVDKVCLAAPSTPGKSIIPEQRQAAADSRLNDDLEFGDAITQGNDLAVARPVDDEFVHGHSSPNTIDFDSDAKPATSTHRRRRFGLCMILFVAAVLIGIVGAVVGMTLTRKATKESKGVEKASNDKKLFSRELVARFVKKEELDDVNSPYRKALDWISSHDAMVTTPDNPRFIQRYILAYFYYATSKKQPWTSDCVPSADHTGTNSCSSEFKSVDNRVEKRQAFKLLSNTDECEWAGIKCDLSFQIAKIRLGGIGMTGTFPDGIIFLPYLQILELIHGELEGPLPSCISSLKNLHSLDLKNNQFTGTLPESWLVLPTLTDISIDSNRISGTIPNEVFKMNDLTVLGMGKNSFTGTISNDISESLIFIRLDNNNLRGTIPSSIGQLVNLKDFFLSNSKISGTIPVEIGNMKNLSLFDVSGNLLTGTIPEAFWKAKTLVSIYLNDNFLTGTISGKISTLSPLREFAITNNQFTGAIPSRLGMNEVVLIKASGNMFNGTVAPQLCDLVTNGQLHTLEFDCAAPESSRDVDGINGTLTETAEIVCPSECCTKCCTPNGKTCVEM